MNVRSKHRHFWEVIFEGKEENHRIAVESNNFGLFEARYSCFTATGDTPEDAIREIGRKMRSVAGTISAQLPKMSFK